MIQLNFRAVSILIVALFSKTALSQIHHTSLEWVDRSPVVGDALYHSASIVNGGHLYVTSNVRNINGNTDIMTIKYDTNGDTLWVSTYAGSANGDDYGVDIKFLSGNIWVVGAAKNTGTGYDYCTLRYNSTTGAQTYVNNFNGAGNGDDIPTALLVESSAVYVCGGSEATNGFSDFAVNKLNFGPGGTWTKYYNYANLHDGATSIISSGTNVIVTGGSAAAVGDWDLATLKIHKLTGSMTVTRTNITGATMVEANSMTSDSLNNIYITGYAEVSGNKNIQTIKLDSNLALTWIVDYVDSYDDVANDLGVDGYGNIYVTGYTELSTGGTNFVTLKYDPAGSLLWSSFTGNGSQIETCASEKIAVTNEGESFIAGTINNGGSSNMRIVKYNTSGQEYFIREFSTDNVDYSALDIRLNGSDIYVTGVAERIDTTELTVLKYSILETSIDAVVDSAGNNPRVKGEIVVRFNPDFIIEENVNNKDKMHGELGDFVDIVLLDRISDSIGYDVSKFECYKVHPNRTTADTISISRGGHVVRLAPFYASFGIIIPPFVDDSLAKNEFTLTDGSVLFADFNAIYELHAGANDTEYQNGNHGALVATVAYPDANINIEPAWDIFVGTTSISCGVFDSGIRRMHDDISDGTFSNSSVVDGYNYITGSPILLNENSDDIGHGTAVAGIIGAWRDNSYGSVGVAGGSGTGDGVVLHDMKIFAENLSNCFPIAATSTQIAQAIVDGAISTTSGGLGQYIQNHSWGGFHNFEVEDAMQTAHENEVFIVVSSGNAESGIPGDCNFISYPAHLKDDWITQVGANDTTGARAGFSNCGSTKLDFIAPGVIQLYSPLDHEFNTFNDTHEYGNSCSKELNGTSLAAPHVAGTGALMIGYYNDDIQALSYMAPEDCEQLMQYYATDITAFPNSPGVDMETGYGRLNAGNTVQGISLPEYNILHFEFEDSTFESVYINQISYENEDVYGILPGANTPLASVLNVTKYEFIATNTHSIPSGYNLVSGWKRDALSTGYGDYSVPSGGTIVQPIHHFPNEVDVEMLTYDANSATLHGYVYEIFAFDLDSGYYIPVGWYPHDTATAVKFAYTLYIQNPNVGIDEETMDSGIDVYPNPANNMLNVSMVSSTDEISSIQLYDLGGRLIETYSFIQGSQQVSVNVEGFTNGVYFVKVLCSGKEFNEKVVICH
ncbi:MAG: S8 family serine peptidase [Crocinitomicaceae bacterium]|nr:S8 family serine peptidase [Crocinitomicaceae bacterium]MBK8926685.1 S8 family serine peptidase [Crocinitomicaceae bacterium]